MAEIEENDEHISVLRHHNRAQRSVNRQLRRALKRHQDNADAVFLDICETQTEAELAMEKLWTLGKLNCDPSDYESIIDILLDAYLNGVRRDKPIDHLEA